MRILIPLASLRYCHAIARSNRPCRRNAFQSGRLCAGGPLASSWKGPFARRWPRISTQYSPWQRVDDQADRSITPGFGNAQRDSIFRAGSVSKLFNAIAVMQQVEQGKIDLDARVQSYGPQFNLVNPFEGNPPITIRQLLCHRSGMIRESPVGGYFDPSEPGLPATVASIRDCVLVNPPTAKTRYSNIGPSIAGQIVAAVSGTEYVRYQKEHVLDPLGMTSSSYLLSGIDRKRLAKSYMRVADGRGGFVEAAQLRGVRSRHDPGRQSLHDGRRPCALRRDARRRRPSGRKADRLARYFGQDVDAAIDARAFGVRHRLHGRQVPRSQGGFA